MKPESYPAKMLKVIEKARTAVDNTIAKAPISLTTSRTNLIRARVVLNSLKNDNSLNQTSIVKKASK
jgi:hypothetical protein